MEERSSLSVPVMQRSRSPIPNRMRPSVVSASNTYDFTVKQKVNALASVSVSGTTNPGQKLTATASGASTYQWYKRKSGSTQRVAVPGATSSTYTLQPSDIGYEFNVDVGASGYATMSSGYTKAVTSVKPSGIDTSNIKDSSVDAMAKGIDGAEYEYAYATSKTGNKIITHRSKDKVTISGLSRNKDYWLFTRVAGDENGSYEPSEWSDPVPDQDRKDRCRRPDQAQYEYQCRFSAHRKYCGYQSSDR